MFCIYQAVPTKFSRHKALLDEVSESNPKWMRKNDSKGERAVAKANKGIIVKGPDINTREDSSRTCSSNLEGTPPEYYTDEMTVADVNNFGDTGDPTPTKPELERSEVSTISEGRSVTAASRTRQS